MLFVVLDAATLSWLVRWLRQVRFIYFTTEETAVDVQGLACTAQGGRVRPRPGSWGTRVPQGNPSSGGPSMAGQGPSAPPRSQVHVLAHMPSSSSLGVW